MNHFWSMVLFRDGSLYEKLRKIINVCLNDRIWTRTILGYDSSDLQGAHNDIREKFLPLSYIMIQ